MAEIAAGLGDEYIDTGSIAGLLPRCMKGDGVLTVDGGVARRLVVEMTHSDSARTGWNDYLDNAERNRHAAAALGLVPNRAQNGGHTIRCLGARRIVMAFDPASDDPQLLRTVVQLLRVAAISASSRRDVEDIKTVDEKITALALLGRLDEIKPASQQRSGCRVRRCIRSSDPHRDESARIDTGPLAAASPPGSRCRCPLRRVPMPPTHAGRRSR